LKKPCYDRLDRHRPATAHRLGTDASQNERLPETRDGAIPAPAMQSPAFNRFRVFLLQNPACVVLQFAVHHSADGTTPPIQ
jgi:hypothetical protein